MKTIQLYEAGEGVSEALARINPGRGRPAMHPTIKGMDFALLPDESASKTPTQSLASRNDFMDRYVEDSHAEPGFSR